MDQKHKPYVAPVMAYFSCDEKMAHTIIRSAEKNGELEAIKRMCGSRRDKQHGE